jgi:nucleotide-binding universal stress UspA family protein
MEDACQSSPRTQRALRTAARMTAPNLRLLVRTRSICGLCTIGSAGPLGSRFDLSRATAAARLVRCRQTADVRCRHGLAYAVHVEGVMPRIDMTDSPTPYVIMTALQFDDTGERALEQASRIAQRDPAAEVHVIHAIAPSLAPERNGESTSIAVQLARAPEKLREYVDRACAGTSLKVVAHVRSGTPHQVILQAAADYDADLIVLGTHRRSGLEKLLLGSVAERVFRDAHCAVLLAAPKSHDARAANASIEPPCPDCVAARNAAHDPGAWCERHSHGRLRPHVYTPSDRPNPSSFGT